MNKDIVTKEQVYTKLGKRLAGDIIERKGYTDDGYNMKKIEEDVWIAYPSSGFDHIGASRVIVISKATGEILVDKMIGE